MPCSGSTPCKANYVSWWDFIIATVLWWYKMFSYQQFQLKGFKSTQQKHAPSLHVKIQSISISLTFYSGNIPVTMWYVLWLETAHACWHAVRCYIALMVCFRIAYDNDSDLYKQMTEYIIKCYSVHSGIMCNMVDVRLYIRYPILVYWLHCYTSTHY